MSDRGYLSYLVTGASYALAGTVALCAVGALAARRKLKPKNCWNNQKTLDGLLNHNFPRLAYLIIAVN